MALVQKINPFRLESLPSCSSFTHILMEDKKPKENRKT